MNLGNLAICRYGRPHTSGNCHACTLLNSYKYDFPIKLLPLAWSWLHLLQKSSCWSEFLDRVTSLYKNREWNYLYSQPSVMWHLRRLVPCKCSYWYGMRVDCNRIRVNARVCRLLADIIHISSSDYKWSVFHYFRCEDWIWKVECEIVD